MCAVWGAVVHHGVEVAKKAPARDFLCHLYFSSDHHDAWVEI